MVVGSLCLVFQPALLFAASLIDAWVIRHHVRPVVSLQAKLVFEQDQTRRFSLAFLMPLDDVAGRVFA